MAAPGPPDPPPVGDARAGPGRSPPGPGRETRGPASGRRAVGPPEEGTPAAGRLRRLRTRYPSGVVVVACRVPEGLRGVTVSSFAAVSLEPPLVLFCLDRELESEGLLRETEGFGISVLSDRQELLSQRFAAAAPLVDDAFTGAPYFVRESGAPLLEGAVAWFDCRPHATYDGGDHTIFVGRVVWAAENPRQPMPLVTFSRYYAGLSNMRPP